MNFEKNLLDKIQGKGSCYRATKYGTHCITNWNKKENVYKVLLK